MPNYFTNYKNLKSVEELEEALIADWKTVEDMGRERMAEGLYILNAKLRAQGKKGQGFETWVEKNLGITGRTARRWVAWYKEKIAEKPRPKPKSKNPTSGQVAGSSDETPKPKAAEEGDDGDGKEKDGEPEHKLAPDALRPYPIEIMVTEAQEIELDLAIASVGERLSVVVYDAVMRAADANSTPLLSQAGGAECRI